MKLSTVIVAALFSLASAQAPSPSGSASGAVASGAAASGSAASGAVASSGAAVSSGAAASGGAANGGAAVGGGSGGAIISVTAPLQGASYKAGDKAIISWINPTVASISQIVLAKGGSNSLQPVNTIATNVPAASGSYVWNIPADTPPGSDYAFEFGTSPNLAFTGQFSITGGSGAGAGVSSSVSNAGTNSSSAAVPGSGASSSSPSSPASGSAAKPVSGSGSSSSGSGAAAQGSSSSSAANSLNAGSMAVMGAAIVAVAQFF